MDCIIVNSPHSEFASPTLGKLCSVSNGKPIIVDMTGMLRKNDEMRRRCRYRTL